MAQLILKRKEIVLDDDKQPVIIHRETDTDCVIMPDGTHTLSEFLVNFGVRRTVVVTGDATGMTSYNPSESGTVEIPVEITDDSHNHTGATVHMTEGNRVVVSAEDKGLAISVVTSNELNTLSGINGNVQAQLNGKAAEDHDHDGAYLKQTALGSINGVAPLGPDGRISARYLPSYVNDTVEGVASEDLTSFTPNAWDEELHGPFVLESDKIYSDTNTNKTYRWGGTRLIPIGGGGVELGETSETAYRGDRGAAAYLHSQAAHARADATRVESSVTNGNISIDGVQTVVYAHPSVTVTDEADSGDISSTGTFQAITAIEVNSAGHVTGRTIKTFKITPALIGAVPTTRTVNGKALSANINLTPADIGAASASHGVHVTYDDETSPLMAGTASPGTASTVARSDHIHPAQTTITGNAGSATKLATARTFRVNLASTSTASFNGTANVTPGVTGTLPLANGGTGATTAAAARTKLGVINVQAGTTKPTDQAEGDLWFETLS